ncbi:hypothetical protein [Dysgonomonas alginatilytica]|nr:hypothetical protein [Dysgonomonas alginatilytica]
MKKEIVISLKQVKTFIKSFLIAFISLFLIVTIFGESYSYHTPFSIGNDYFKAPSFIGDYDISREIDLYELKLIFGQMYWHLIILTVIIFVLFNFFQKYKVSIKNTNETNNKED